MSVGNSNNYVNIQTKPTFCGIKAMKITNKWRRSLKYIDLTKNSPVSDTFIKGRAGDIESLGIVGKKIIKKQNLKFCLAQKTTDAFPEFKGQCPRGWTKDSTWDDTSALYKCYKDGSGVIGLFEKPTKNSAAKVDAVRHEVGHQGNKMFLKIINCCFTDTKNFTNAYLEDLKNLPKNFRNFRKKIYKKAYYEDKKNNKFEPEKFKEWVEKSNKWFRKKLDYISQGSTPKQATDGGKDEAFAEIFATLNGGSGDKEKDQLYKAVFPNTVASVEKLLRLLEKH